MGDEPFLGRPDEDGLRAPSPGPAGRFSHDHKWCRYGASPFGPLEVCKHSRRETRGESRPGANLRLCSNRLDVHGALAYTFGSRCGLASLIECRPDLPRPLDRQVGEIDQTGEHLPTQTLIIGGRPASPRSSSRPSSEVGTTAPLYGLEPAHSWHSRATSAGWPSSSHPWAALVLSIPAPGSISCLIEGEGSLPPAAAQTLTASDLGTVKRAFVWDGDDSPDVPRLWLPRRLPEPSWLCLARGHYSKAQSKHHTGALSQILLGASWKGRHRRAVSLPIFPVNCPRE